MTICCVFFLLLITLNLSLFQFTITTRRFLTLKKMNVRDIKVSGWPTHLNVYWPVTLDGFEFQDHALHWKFVNLWEQWRSLHESQLLSETKTVLWLVLLLLWEYFEWLYLSVAFHRDSQLECWCFLSVLPGLFVVNVCLDSQNLPPTIKGRENKH